VYARTIISSIIEWIAYKENNIFLTSALDKENIVVREMIFVYYNFFFVYKGFFLS
jgi:hypothetical protein